MPQPRQKSYVNEGETDLQKQVRLGPEAKLQALPASFLSKMSIANPRHREKKNIACPVSNRDVVTGTTRPCMPSKALLIGCKYGINRNCCSFQPVRLRGCGYGRIQSEFGVPRGGTAWRARGPPMMAAIETGVRVPPYPVILSQLPAPLVLSPHTGALFEPAGHCKASF